MDEFFYLIFLNKSFSAMKIVNKFTIIFLAAAWIWRKNIRFYLFVIFFLQVISEIKRNPALRKKDLDKLYQGNSTIFKERSDPIQLYLDPQLCFVVMNVLQVTSKEYLSKFV